MGPADSDRITRVLPYSGTARSARRRSGTGISPSASPAFQPLPVRSPLLGESIFLSPPAGTGMFRFPAFARIAACAPSRRAGCPIRTPPDLVPFADPRGVSPLTASFIASGSLGIHRVPLSCSFAHAAHNARHRLQSTSRVSVLYLVSSSRCSLPLLLLSQHFNEQPFFSNGLQRYDFFSTLQIF